MYWSYLHQFFSVGIELREGLINRSFFLRSLKGCCRGNQFCDQIWEFGRPHPHLSHWHSKTVCRITTVLSKKINGNDFSVLCTNLVSFGLVTLELSTTIESVQQASINAGVCLTTFAMGAAWLLSTAIGKRVCFTTIR